MNCKEAISHSENILVIHLEKAPLDKIVQEKLTYDFKYRLDNNELLSRYFYPVEKALIETVLQIKEKNQIQAAEALGINRNTLRNKLKILKIDLKARAQQNPSFVCEKLFLTTWYDLNLFDLSRRKFILERKNKTLIENLQACKKPIEKAILKTVLKEFNFRQVKSSQFLGINRNTLKKKLLEHQLEPLQ